MIRQFKKLKLTVRRLPDGEFTVIFLICFLCAVVLTGLLSSCVSTQRAVTVLNKKPIAAMRFAKDKMRDNVDTLGELCHIYYPCVDKVETTTDIKQGEIKASGEVQSVDVSRLVDSILSSLGNVKYDKDSKPIYIQVPVYVRTDTASIVKSVTQTDKAAYNVLKNDFNALQVSSAKQVTELQTELRTAKHETSEVKRVSRLYAISLFALVILLIAYFVIKNYTKLLSKIS